MNFTHPSGKKPMKKLGGKALSNILSITLKSTIFSCQLNSLTLFIHYYNPLPITHHIYIRYLRLSQAELECVKYEKAMFDVSVWKECWNGSIKTSMMFVVVELSYWRTELFPFRAETCFEGLHTIKSISSRVFLNFWVGLFLFKAMQEVSQVG